MSIVSSNTSGRKSGFALLITIVLVAFLVLILVGLATFTRVETQVADNSQKVQVARQNALMGLNIALGKLQEYAGPDQRVTSTGSAISATAENPFFTAVWDASGSSTTPMTWLVSGNELAPVGFAQNTVLNRTNASPDVPLTISPATGLATNGPSVGALTVNRVRLVGAASADLAGVGLNNGAVVVPGVPIDATVPGFSGNRTIGRYAYWVGDQGVKASVSLPDRSNQVTYAPWETAAERLRLRQQMAGTPTLFSNVVGDEFGLDPLSAANLGQLERVALDNQLRLLTPATATPLSPFLRENFHAVTSVTYGVLANTRTDALGGLMKDLSLAPNLLGAAFTTRADFTTYMEMPSGANVALPPILDDESERRRYVITPPVNNTANAATAAPAAEFSVAPVLSEFIMQFRVRRNAANVQLSTRACVGLWNPYTSALVPEDLTLEVSGLPILTVEDTIAASPIQIDLQNAAPPTIRLNATTISLGLPWRAPASRTETDTRSWLPGRLYNWATVTGASPPSALNFYEKNLNGLGWDFAPVALGGTSAALRASAPAVTLTLVLKRGAAVLATYTSPQIPNFSVADTSAPPADSGWKFAYGFRLRQPSSTSTDRSWLTTAGSDPRRSQLGATAFVAFDATRDFDPSAYIGTISTANDVNNFALFRSQGSSFDSRRAQNDLPLFELPRLPHISLGELQHLLVTDGRPFDIGNSWKNGGNRLFDRYFFSGLPLAVADPMPNLASNQPFPNWSLRPVDTRAAPAGPLAAADIHADGEDSAQKLLQAGAFNINSADQAAWTAVLSGVRFSDTRPFRRADIKNTPNDIYLGSQTDAATDVTDERLVDVTLNSTVGALTGGASFFRFPQSAAETYDWDGTAPPSLSISREPFRRGVRGGSAGGLRALTRTQIDLLAQAIVVRVRQKFADSGPFRNLEEFLNPNTLFGGASLLEDAILSVNTINPPAIAPLATVAGLTDSGLSSISLTQADLMTALAPFLRSRSDTFLVRAFGEAINPTTGVVEGRAWCEAKVQRIPTPVQGVNLADFQNPPGLFGRKFTIISFRWLSTDDI